MPEIAATAEPDAGADPRVPGRPAQVAPTALLPLVGTHRVCKPQETLRRIAPAFEQVGITRLADLTGLDEIAIPVYQAVRPDSRTLSVSQGKGLSSALAKVSAAMEAIELWHAENMTLPVTRAPIGDIAPALPYEVTDLCLDERYFLADTRTIDWIEGTALADRSTVLVPASYIRLDGVPRTEWSPPLFEATSNGLASGNTVAEATLHGLYEVLERDSLDRADLERMEAERAVDLSTVDGVGSAWCLERLSAAGVAVRAFEITGDTGIPAFSARIWSESMPIEFSGHGCHLDKDVALCRALTEAAQSRLTIIAGSRDDIGRGLYDYCHDFEAQSLVERPPPTAGGRSYAGIPSAATLDVERALDYVVGRICSFTGRSPIVVNLTQPRIGVPVARVVAPGLRRSVEH